MNMPFSQSDRASSAYTAADLEFVLVTHIKRAEALANAIKALRYEGKTLREACGDGDLESLRAEFEWSLLGFREGAAHAATGREVPYGNVPALVVAVRELTDEMEIAAGRRPRDPLATAMRRVDALEAAERSLIAPAHATGADLARLDADHPYGKSAAPASPKHSHAAYEASFHPSSAA